MKIIGITGNSGSGKSTIAKSIKEKYNGIIIDADKIAKEMTNYNSKYLEEIIRIFGTKIIKNNKLDRKELSKIVFNDKKERDKLNKLTFKYVVDEIKNRINIIKGKDEFIILDVPLLFESKLNELCDFVIGVIADQNEKVDRICKRDNINQEEALKRIKSQPEDRFYIENCNYIIKNSNAIKLNIEIEKIMNNLNITK